MGDRNSCSTPIIIVWICVILCLISKVDTVYVELDCPMKFQEGNNSVTCIVDLTLLSSKCSRTLNNIQFIYTKPDQITQVNECETPIYRIPNICPSTFSTGKNSNSTCQCREISGNLVKYHLNFQANEALHAGITWICNVCSTQDPVDVNFTLCSNITFDNTGNGSSSGNLTTEAIIGIVIGAIAAVALTVFISLAIYHFACGNKLCGKQGYTPCCKPAGNDKIESSSVQLTENQLYEAHPMRHPN